MKDYLIQRIIEWLNAASEHQVNLAYTYIKALLHR